DRVLEAQQVLELLKIQELDDYLRNLRGSDRPAQSLDYSQAERHIIDLYNQAIVQGQELSKLRQIPEGNRTPAEQQRIAELVANQQNLIESFDDFLDRPEVAEAIRQLSRTSRRQNLDLEQLNGLQDNLRNLNQNAVLLYPFILNDRLELVLVTPYSTPIRRTVTVTREELNKAIAQFRVLLTDRTSDPEPQAQQLYQWLIKPIEQDLKQVNAETILYAPDAQLRYIPLAALHDGEQWLIQRFQINSITAASLTDFDTPPDKTVRVLAGAFTEGNVNFQVGSRQFSFRGLPFAEVEIDNIAAEIPDTTTLVNRAFSPQATIPRMDDYTVVHLATHAEFVPGQPDESFILFGNGDRVPLRDISTWSLPNVDLVVLSACETAVGGELGNGEEILGLGYQVQRTGARAAIASLWSVDDGGTQVLMNAFYSGLEGGLTKAEALRQAQIALITGEASSMSARRGTVEIVSAQTGLSERAQLDSPYYWAPFILIGNGL
ncbi:MAG TPA: CHAT domain-containing protein, partial [Leptolyngbyaceae cyanobacterium]